MVYILTWNWKATVISIATKGSPKLTIWLDWALMTFMVVNDVKNFYKWALYTYSLPFVIQVTLNPFKGFIIKVTQWKFFDPQWMVNNIKSCASYQKADTCKFSPLKLAPNCHTFVSGRLLHCDFGGNHFDCAASIHSSLLHINTDLTEYYFFQHFTQNWQHGHRQVYSFLD